MMLMLKSAKTMIEDVTRQCDARHDRESDHNAFEQEANLFWGFRTPNKQSDLRENNDSEPDAHSRRLWPIPSAICPGSGLRPGRQPQA